MRYLSEHGNRASEGYTRNFPLRLGRRGMPTARLWKRRRGDHRNFGADALVVSLGVDTAAEDPDRFQLVAGDFTRIGAAIGALALPTLVVQEGGYDLDVIGRNVVNVLRR